MNSSTKTAELKRNPLTEAGITYSLAALLPMILAIVLMLFARLAGEGYANESWYKYLSFLVPQLCFALAALLFFRRAGTSLPPKKVYTPCKWYYFLLALGLAFGLFLALNQLNEYFIRFLELFGYTRTVNQPDYTPPVTDAMVQGWAILPAILIIAVLPAIFEETIFRGILSGSMRSSGWGTAATVLTCGALFSLFHGNPEQTLYQFVCGACYTLLAIRAGSIFPTVLAHFANNAVILILGAVKGVQWAIPQTLGIILGCVAGAVLVGVLVYLVFFDKNGNRKGGAKDGKIFLLAASVGILVCAIEWIATLVTGIMA